LGGDWGGAGWCVSPAAAWFSYTLLQEERGSAPRRESEGSRGGYSGPSREPHVMRGNGNLSY
jgi:hypothetical protein